MLLYGNEETMYFMGKLGNGVDTVDLMLVVLVCFNNNIDITHIYSDL